jgi:hypothetical protein
MIPHNSNEITEKVIKYIDENFEDKKILLEKGFSSEFTIQHIKLFYEKYIKVQMNLNFIQEKAIIWNVIVILWNIERNERQNLFP